MTRRLLLATLLLLGIAPAAQAACVGLLGVSATAVSFQAYSPLSASPKTAVGSVTIGCVGLGLLPNAIIKLSSGSAGSFAPRKMKNGGAALNYNLYTDTGSVWGDGSPGTAVKEFKALLSLGSISYPVDGRIPAGQDAAPGSYSDAISVIVEF